MTDYELRKYLMTARQLPEWVEREIERLAILLAAVTGALWALVILLWWVV